MRKMELVYNVIKKCVQPVKFPMIFVLFLAKPTVKPVHPKIHVKAV